MIQYSSGPQESVLFKKTLDHIDNLKVEKLQIMKQIKARFTSN